MPKEMYSFKSLCNELLYVMILTVQWHTYLLDRKFGEFTSYLYILIWKREAF